MHTPTASLARLIYAPKPPGGFAARGKPLTPHHYTDKKKSVPNWRNIMHEKRAIRFHGIALLNKTILYLILFFFT